MKPRSGAGGGPIKGRRRKAPAPKRHDAPKVAARSNPPTIAEKAKVARLGRGRDEAVEHLSAASDVLKVITSSPGDLTRVFEAILANATRLSDAKFGALWLREGDVFRICAGHLPSSVNVAIYQPDMTFALHENPNVPIARMVATKAILHVADLRTDQSYIERSPRIVPLVEIVGARTFLGVPMLKNNELVGAFVIYRTEVRLFTEKQIALVQNFAAQAVIAIENARLLNELRQRTTDLTERTTDLTEALEQQTATSEVLQVISGSPGDLQPVFATMLEKAVRICDAKFGTLYLFEDGRLRLMAAQQVPRIYGSARGRAERGRSGRSAP
jgi:two-component system, NtrC family, sensor kinase